MKSSIIIILFTFVSCLSKGGSGDSSILSLLFLNSLNQNTNNVNKTNAKGGEQGGESNTNNCSITRTVTTSYLPNRINMPFAYGCIKIDYGNDVKCTEDLGVWGQTSGTNKCVVSGKTTKIEYVKTVIRTYIDKMKAKGIDITPALRTNSPTLFMFNKLSDKNNAEAYMDSIGRYGQDLQADETFVLKDSAQGYSSTARRRNAAMEEIIHLLHNSALSQTKPDWQVSLNTETNNALRDSKLDWADNNNDGVGDDENALPKSDLDDEFFADGVEAYFKLRGGSGYIKPTSVCVSRNCGATNSNAQLKANFPSFYTLIENLFGTPTSFYP